MGFILSLILGIVPMLFYAWFIYWLDRYEKEPKVLLGAVFLWGAIFAAGAAYIVNTLLGVGVYLLSGSETTTDLTTGLFIAPIIEEGLKGIAVLLVFLVFRKEFDSILDGIVYAAITALGFAATENVIYIYEQGFQQNGFLGLMWLAVVRDIIVGWQHPFYTSFIGIGLAIARLNRNEVVKILAPIAGWLLAVTTHSLHNTLANILPGLGGFIFGSIADWTGWFFMFCFVLWAIYREQQYMTQLLKEEVKQGIISQAHYRTACSSFNQSLARIKALTSGHYHITNRFYQACAELAHKKNQRNTLGEEGGNSKTIEALRKELFHLGSQAFVA